MTSRTSKDIKALFFIPSSVRDDYKNLPEDVLETANFVTSSLQNGQYLPRGMIKSLKGNLAGLIELKVSHDTNTYRAYYAASFESAIYILDAGLKKSHQGGEIPREQRNRLTERHKLAVQHYAENRTRIEKEAEERRKLRESQEDSDGPRPQ